MQTPDRPLSVGAGPVGLAAAAFLAREGITTRLVEKNHEASVQSKALAVNPRTLEILEAVGLTERMLAMGKKVRGACLWHRHRLAATIDFTSRLKAKYPFMLALSQAATERLLEQTLVDLGGNVERGVRLADCENEAEGVSATLDTPHGEERYHAEWLLAADGAHSTARDRLGIEFPGSAFRDKWDLADVPLATSLAEDHAHAIFLPNREFQFMIRVIDPQLERTVSGPLWRVIGNQPGLLDRLATGTVIGPPVWSSSFGVSHRINRAMSVGRVYFAGDAAHLHSPVGARGMNLGIEDAWVFAQLVRRGQLSRYQHLRYAIDRRVVRQVNVFSRIVACEPAALSVFRRLLAPLVRLGVPTARMMAIITGTDHPMSEFAAVPAEAPRSGPSSGARYPVLARERHTGRRISGQGESAPGTLVHAAPALRRAGMPTSSRCWRSPRPGTSRASPIHSGRIQPYRSPRPRRRRRAARRAHPRASVVLSRKAPPPRVLQERSGRGARTYWSRPQGVPHRWPPAGSV